MVSTEGVLLLDQSSGDLLDYAAFSVDVMRPYLLILRIAGIFSETLAAVAYEERGPNSAYRGS